LKDEQNKTYLKLVEGDLKVQLRSKEFWSCNAFEVIVGTNTPCGGDAGHGGRTLFRLRNLVGTCWDISVDGKEVTEPDELTIVLAGDTEAETFADSLIFAGRTLKKQMRETRWRELCSRVFALETKEQVHEEE
jgi:hypothetical protein